MDYNKNELESVSAYLAKYNMHFLGRQDVIQNMMLKLTKELIGTKFVSHATMGFKVKQTPLDFFKVSITLDESMYQWEKV